MSNEQPSAPFTPPPSAPQMDNNASLGKRLGAFLLDWVFLLIATAFLFQFLGVVEADPNTVKDMKTIESEMIAKLAELSTGQKMVIQIFPYLAFLAINGYLLRRYGQTIGKRILGIAIVTMDNRVPPFTPLIVQRYLTQWVAGQLPLIGAMLLLADVLAMFRPDRRCIHDHLARTKVIDLRIPVVHSEAASEASAVPSNTLIV